MPTETGARVIHIPKLLKRYLRREAIRAMYLRERPDGGSEAALALIDQNIDLLAMAWRALDKGDTVKVKQLLAPLDEEWARAKPDLRWDWKQQAFVPDPTWGWG